jgi:O-antigen ligase
MTDAVLLAPRLRTYQPFAHLGAIALRTLHLALNAPVTIFLLALTAMLFRPPDLKTLPVDRITFIALVAVFALRLCLRRERLQLFPATWPMAALTTLALSGALQEGNAQAWSLLAAKWIVPFALFHMAGSIFRDRDSLRKLELFSVVVLCYLTLVSLLFLFNLKFLIFPGFILDESIGIHSDRARGPLLQAVANGVCLNILGLIALDCYRRRSVRRFWALLLFVAVPLALLATRTRAVWFAAAVSLLLIIAFARHHRLQRPAIALCSVTALVGCSALIYGAACPGFDDRLRDRSPVEFRLDMYRAGWEMFAEKPIAGWGSEAAIQPEIAKRMTSFRPERYLFHNTYLELGVERGLIGLGLYAWLLVCLFRLATRPRGHFISETHFLDMSFRLLWPAILVVYFLNASAVVMNYQFVNGFFFTLAGILSAQNANRAGSLVRRES